MTTGETLAARILDRLAARGETLAVAESLTGGLLAATLVDEPGASRVFRGGLIVYAVDLKTTLADVPADLLAERGPVASEVATALATGARNRCGADWGLATTGVAGPGPADEHPAGTVWVAVANRHGAQARLHTFSGDRSTVRTGAVTAALTLLSERCLCDNPPS
jgi:nicotinamide-nucleotide amidase